MTEQGDLTDRCDRVGQNWRYEQQGREVAELGDTKGKEESWLNRLI
jgi:hypothetical protein